MLNISPRNSNFARGLIYACLDLNYLWSLVTNKLTRKSFEIIRNMITWHVVA